MEYEVQIVMLAYNHEKYIHRAIDSVLMQKTNFNFKIVISDDCSTDRTREICLSYKEKYPDKFELLFSDKNIGAIENGKKLFGFPNAKYVAVCEGDDYWKSDRKLQLQYDFLEKNNDYTLHFHNVEIVDQYDKHIGYVYPLEQNDNDYYFNDLLDGTIYFKTCSVMYRNKMGLLDFFIDNTIPFYDVTLFVKLFEFDGKARYSSSINSVYRVHGGGIYSMIGDLKRKMFALDIYSSLLEYYRIQPYKNILKKRVLFLMLEVSKLRFEDGSCWISIKTYFDAFRFFIFDKSVLKQFLKVFYSFLVRNVNKDKLI